MELGWCVSLVQCPSALLVCMRLRMLAAKVCGCLRACDIILAALQLLQPRRKDTVLDLSPASKRWVTPRDGVCVVWEQVC
jgi:hypothetical protein